MDIHQLKTFVTVAREGSITRASELVHLSQPAVSAHIKALEDALGLALFDRTAKGMTLTPDGQRLLSKAEQTIAAHRDLLDEATRLKGRLAGKLRLGVGGASSHQAVGRLVAGLAERCPEVEVSLVHGSSVEILAGVRAGTLDVGFANEPETPTADLLSLEVTRFAIFVAGPKGQGSATGAPDWKALAELPWIYPPASACCGRTAEVLFKTERFRPRRVINVERGEVTRTLIAAGIGIGLLHADAAQLAQEAGEADLLFRCPGTVKVLLVGLATRAKDPLVAAAMALLSRP